MNVMIQTLGATPAKYIAPGIHMKGYIRTSGQKRDVKPMVMLPYMSL